MNILFIGWLFYTVLMGLLMGCFILFPMLLAFSSCWRSHARRRSDYFFFNGVWRAMKAVVVYLGVILKSTMVISATRSIYRLLNVICCLLFFTRFLFSISSAIFFVNLMMKLWVQVVEYPVEWSGVLFEGWGKAANEWEKSKLVLIKILLYGFWALLCKNFCKEET